MHIIPPPKNRSRRGTGDESGVALVEFALVLPLLLLIILGIFDFGRAINYWNDAQQMANEGARWAVVDRRPGGGSSLQDDIRRQASTAEFLNGSSSVTRPAKVCISFPNGTSNVGDPVTVTVSATYQWLPFLALGMTTTTFSSTATMRLERLPSTYSAGCA
jgi:Flp pilus assembly protein TadG